jgi:hypothetical protein
VTSVLIIAGGPAPHGVLPARGSIALRSVESAGPLPAGCRIELGQAETIVHVWSVDALREDEDCATDFLVFVEDPGPRLPVGAGTVLRVRGPAPGDIMWVALDSDDVMP